MYGVPEKFKPRINTEYPPNNKILFEEWFSERAEDGKRIYLPIFFTSYQVNSNYGNDKKALSELQEFVDSIDRDNGYYFPVQYDDGPLVDFKDLDIKVFGSGGGRIDFPIPLICHPHPYKFDVPKNVFCSFNGSMTHPIRKQIVKLFRHKSNMSIHWLPMNIKVYCEMMARSIFALAPRGYGQSSFRICEALQYGAIPVYISDHWIVPGNIDFNEYGVLVHNDEIRNLDKILKGFTNAQIESKREAGKYYYEKMYTFEGAKQLILDNI